MPSEHILRIARDDEEGRYILMNVSSSGPSPLDLKLLATEGESPYVLYRERLIMISTDPNSSTIDEVQSNNLMLKTSVHVLAISMKTNGKRCYSRSFFKNLSAVALL